MTRHQHLEEKRLSLCSLLGILLFIWTLNSCGISIPVPVSVEEIVDAVEMTEIPEIIDFGPSSGSVGTNVRIVGINFSTTAHENIIRFENVESQALEVVTGETGREIIAVVPEGVPMGMARMSVEVNGETSNDVYFQVIDAREYPAGIRPAAVTSGDLDGDGYIDLAVVNRGVFPDYHGSVSVLMGNGDGTFGSDVQYDTGNGSVSVNIGDFDSDSIPDLAVANFDSDSVSVLLNNGYGSFETHIPVPAGNGPSCVTTGDLDGNGYLDLAVADFGSDSVSILLNAGSGSFSRVPESLPAGRLAYAVTTADLDRDGDSDMIVTNGYDVDRQEVMLTILRNQSEPGNLWFSPEEPSLLGAEGPRLEQDQDQGGHVGDLLSRAPDRSA